MFHTPASAICRKPATEKDTSAKCASSPCPGVALSQETIRSNPQLCLIFKWSVYTTMTIVLHPGSQIYVREREKERHGEENMRAHFHFNVPGWKDLMALTYPSRLTVKVMCRLLLVLGLWSSPGFNGILKADTCACCTPSAHTSLHYVICLTCWWAILISELVNIVVQPWLFQDKWLHWLVIGMKLLVMLGVA